MENNHADVHPPPPSQSTSIWLESFESYDACIQYQRRLDYGTNDMAAFVSERWVQRMRAMYQLAKNSEYPKATCLPQFMELNRESRIFDFGGGSGWTIELLNEKTLSRLESYVVIEQPEFLERLKSITSAPQKLEFCSPSDIRPGTSSSDGVFYANSSLQYLSSDEEARSIILSTRPNWLLFDDLQMSKGQEFWSLQRYYGRHIPCRFFNLEKVVMFLQELGYQQIFNFPYPKRYADGWLPRIEESSGLLPNLEVPLTIGFRMLTPDIQEGLRG